MDTQYYRIYCKNETLKSEHMWHTAVIFYSQEKNIDEHLHMLTVFRKKKTLKACWTAYVELNFCAYSASFIVQNYIKMF